MPSDYFFFSYPFSNLLSISIFTSTKPANIYFNLSKLSHLGLARLLSTSTTKPSNIFDFFIYLL